MPQTRDDDEGGEVFYFDFSDGFHAEAFEVDGSDGFDAILGRDGGGAEF